MEIGISSFLTDYSVDVAVVARRAEELGFTSLWLPEHSILPVNSGSPWPGSADGKIPKVYADIVDPFVALGRASAVTTTLKLGTGICLVPERNPLLLAKEVATIDMYSKGRFQFGIGAGWLREETDPGVFEKISYAGDGPVGAAVVHKQDLEIGICLRERAQERRSQMLACVVGGDDN